MLDSADAATDLALSEIFRLQSRTTGAKASGPEAGRPKRASARIGRAYFRNYRGLGLYEDVWSHFFDPDYLCELSRLVWGLKPGFRILDAGSASGLTVGALRAVGLDAWGAENNGFIHNQTPPDTKPFNLFCDAAMLPFPDGHFDVIYETCLAHLPKRKIGKVLAEFYRVARKGVIFGSVTSELAIAALDLCDLSQGIHLFRSWGEWSELFSDFNFGLALHDPERQAAAWALTVNARRDPGIWFEDEESLQYCLYSKSSDEGA